MFQRFPLARMMAGNATLLSAVYLGAGLLVESVRRVTNARWADQMSAAMDRLPMRALELLQLSDPLREAWKRGFLNEWWLRVIFGVTTVAIISAIAVFVGIALWGVRMWVDRTSKARV